jgi:hypothetical protein
VVEAAQAPKNVAKLVGESNSLYVRTLRATTSLVPIILLVRQLRRPRWRDRRVGIVIFSENVALLFGLPFSTGGLY